MPFEPDSPKAPRGDFQLDLGPSTKHPGRTKQSDKDGSDLKKIVDRWRRSGETPPFARQPEKALYADFTSVGDYLMAVQQVHDAQAAFDELPARIRDHFNNDPGDLVAAFHDPARLGELEELLLVNPDARLAGVNPLTGEATAEPEPDPDAAGEDVGPGLPLS